MFVFVPLLSEREIDVLFAPHPHLLYGSLRICVVVKFFLLSLYIEILCLNNNTPISRFIKMLFLLHVSVIYDYHQAFINNKMCPRALLHCVSQWIHC
jgi:hypothetical protein